MTFQRVNDVGRRGLLWTPVTILKAHVCGAQSTLRRVARYSRRRHTRIRSRHRHPGPDSTPKHGCCTDATTSVFSLTRQVVRCEDAAHVCAS
jgi:hypothetical protein